MSSIQPVSLLLTVDEQQQQNSSDNNDSLADNPLFTPDLEYYTPPSLATIADMPENTISYKSHTLLSINKARCTILPIFLPSLFLSNEIISMIDPMIKDHQTENNENEPPLLLTNIPGKMS
jgi:hypothetical protein